MDPGPITVISHSISIDLPSLAKAKRIADDKESDEVLDPVTGKHNPRFDPNGTFTTTYDREIMGDRCPALIRWDEAA